MVATVLIRRLTGVASVQTSTDITSINTRDNAEDTHTTAGTANPVQKPASGTNYGFWVSTRLDVTVAPAGTIDNLRWFTDSSNTFGTGITCNGQSATTYIQATGSIGVTGDQVTTSNHSGLTGPTVDVFTFTSGAPKSLTGSTSSTGEFGDYFIYQLQVDTDVSPGASTQETWTWRYDET